MSTGTESNPALPASTGSAVPVTAPRLAAAIARAIFEEGAMHGMKCGRIQFMLRRDETREIAGAGYSEGPLRDFLERKLVELGCPATLPPNAPAQPRREEAK